MTKKQKYKTLDIIKFNENNSNEVVLPREICNIQFPNGTGLSLLASKLFVQLVNFSGSNIIKDKKHTISYSALNWAGREKEKIQVAIIELQKTTVEIKNETSMQSGQILTDVKQDFDVYSGEIDFYFSKTFIEIVKNSNHWATISAKAVLLMECKYSIWLYQLLAPRAGLTYLKPLEISLDELRERLGATAKTYKNWGDLKKAVIEPAIDEVNFLTGLWVSFEPIKKGRWIIGVQFITSTKSPDERVEALKEHEKTRLGRKCRKIEFTEKRKAMFKTLAKSFDN